MALLLKMSAENSSEIYLRTTDDKIISEELRPDNICFCHDQSHVALKGDKYRPGALEKSVKQHFPMIKDYDVEPQQVQINTDDAVALSAAAKDRAHYFQEHTHDENEAWYIQSGQVAFYLRLRNYVYGIICTEGDFICIPGQTRHWFDAGEAPLFSGLRFYLTMNAPVITGDKIALNYPKIEYLHSLITMESTV